MAETQDTISPVQQAWADYTESVYQTWVQPMFAAGFAAGVAHANSTAADPARVQAMEELLREIRDLEAEGRNQFDDFIINEDDWINLRKRIAALLDPAATEDS